MESLAERAEARLLDVIARFTAGEAEVVRAYFAREHVEEAGFRTLGQRLHDGSSPALRLVPLL